MKPDKFRQEIKKEVQLQYQMIKNAEQTLRELREKCKHPITFKGTWQWGGPGHNFDNVKICSICGDLVDKPNYIVETAKKQEK